MTSLFLLPLARPLGPCFSEWKQEFAYIGRSSAEGTKAEASDYFFYNFLSPWIKSLGYSWETAENKVARAFQKFSYALEDAELYTNVKDRHFSLSMPEPIHRNLQEDRETFDYIVNSHEFVDLSINAAETSELLGLRNDHLIIEFCYIYVNVTSGRPEQMTKSLLEMDEGFEGEESGKSNMINLPDAYANRRKYDLY